LKNLIENNKETELSESALKKANTYFTWYITSKGKVKVAFQKEVIDEALKYMGVFCLCSNKINDAVNANINMSVFAKLKM
jgi:hypothetical protein